MSEKEKKPYVTYGSCACGCSGATKEITGCRFSLSPMTDRFVDVILGAIEKVHTDKVWSTTDKLSTIYRGKREHVLDAVKACMVHAYHEGVHMTMEATVSKGCPGDTDAESFLAEDDVLLNEPEIFLQYPEIYEQYPYSAKVAVKTPKRKRPPRLDAEGNEVPKGMPLPRGQNTVSDMLTRFRAFFLWAIDNGYTTNNPFKHFTIGEIVYGTPIYISNEERNQLFEADLSDNKDLETQRDIFVFQCLIGCRVSDLYKMTRRNMIDGAIEYIPRKTKEDRPITVRVPLNETARRLIAKYRDPDRESLFPFNTEQDYNRKIKEAFRRAGLDRMVTVLDQQTRQEIQRPLYEVASSHMARRTFIGNIYKKVKDPNLVGALSGHKEGSRAFARYRTIDDDLKKEMIGFLD